MPDDSDNPWKVIVDEMLVECVQFTRPKLFEMIDWERGYLSLNADLPRLRPKGKTHVLRVDKLIRVYLKNGSMRLLYIHIEIQGYRERYFSRRMLFYSVRIFETYGSFPLSLAILIDPSPNWRPDKFETGIDDCKLQFEYPTLKLLDYANRRVELEASDNLFAAILLAQLDAMETKGKPEERIVRKTALMKSLLRRGIESERIRRLLHFLDWLLILPSELEEEWYNEMDNYSKEKKMPLRDIFEIMGEKRGIRLGEINRSKAFLSDIFEANFGKDGVKLAKKLKGIDDLEKLVQLQRAVIRERRGLEELRELMS